MKTLTLAKLKKELHYNRSTGVFTRRKTGEPAGCVGKQGFDRGGGYRRISVGNEEHYAHQLAWFWVTKSWPAHPLDHQDLNRDNNRFKNLRAADHSRNGANRRRPSNNTSGIKGVSFHKAGQKWRADIKVRGVMTYLGLFGTKEKAAAAYEVAATEGFGAFAKMRYYLGRTRQTAPETV